jgi:D-serine deaminase-like pyridoxal phosphate-dependent protein
MISIGKDLHELDTPSLWVDLDLLEQNIQKLSKCFMKAGIRWRPHTKGIKIPAIAHMLLDAGAIGVTCAKLNEAEIMASAGIRDILVANQIVGDIKVTRLVNLRRRADVMVAVDSIENVSHISRAAVENGVKIRLLIELNTGLERCGLEPGEGVLDFARKVAGLPGVELAGLMTWEGHVTRIADPHEKEKRTHEAIGALLQSAQLCRDAGLRISIISCGGSGSYRITSQIHGITEIQAGGAIFGDLTYIKWGAETNLALFILATVVSRPTRERVVVDAGRKTMNIEYSMPEAVGMPGIQLARLSAEHGILKINDPATDLKIGDKINFFVGYEDLTVFLHNRLYGVRKGKVEVIWDIPERGRLT